VTGNAERGVAKGGWFEVAVVAVAGAAWPPLVTQVMSDLTKPLTWHERWGRRLFFIFMWENKEDLCVI
jgi:hypothetical protein